MKRISYLLISLSILSLIVLSFTFPADKASAEIAAEIIVEPTEGLITDENGTSDSFTVQLDSPAPPNVKIYFSSSDLSEGTVSPGDITLNPSNWDTPEQNVITVTGVTDDINDGDIPYEIIGTTEIGGPVVFTISVTNLNDSFPIANNDYPLVNGFDPIIIPVLDNDTALEDIPLDLTISGNATDGQTEINGDNTITYTPNINSFLGVDQFSYTVCDADSLPDCDSADVIIEDQIPPEIVSVSPVDLGKIFEVPDGEITIEVEAIDNFQVDCVEFIRWDDRIEQYIQLGEVCQPPYTINLDSSTLNYGWNQVYFQATDFAGNLSSFEFIWLYRLFHNFIPVILSR